jgi:hypothetical protein
VNAEGEKPLQALNPFALRRDDHRNDGRPFKPDLPAEVNGNRSAGDE